MSTVVILAMASAVKKINEFHKGRWRPSSPKVTVNVGFEKGGSLKLIAGGAKSTRRTHTITLTFA